MKRIITITLIMSSLLLTACNDTSIGVIGGADGPTNIIVGENDEKVKGRFGEQLEKKLVRMFNVDGELYYDSGLIMSSLLLTACNDTSIGVIGGADGPTNIIVGEKNS